MNAQLMPRTPEPELMDSAEQVAAYAGADFADSNQQFVDTLVGRLDPRQPQGRLIDLGSGPGDICIRLALALPGWRIEGADAGPNMLAAARHRVRELGLDARIRFILSRLPDAALEKNAYDCVVSNSLLHHLPDPQALWQSVRELAAPGARVQVMDLERPESAEAARKLVDVHAAGEPEVLRRDFENSLHAAWRVDEVQAQLERAGLALECERISDRHWLVSGRLNA